MTTHAMCRAYIERMLEQNEEYRREGRTWRAAYRAAYLEALLFQQMQKDAELLALIKHRAEG